MNSRLRIWALALLAAILYSAGQAANLSERITTIPWLELFLFELPVWLGVVIISPIVFWIARRVPLYGEKSTRNFFIHVVAACVVVSFQFLIVESLRRVVISPIVLASGMATTKQALAYAGAVTTVPLLIAALTAFKYYMLFFFFIYFALAIFYHGYTYHRELNSARLRTQELQTLLAKSQLDSLRLQLHPHFLFNTLNTVSSLMSRDIVLARRMLARLSELLRETLSESAAHEVTLASELNFLDAYLEIQSARFGSRLRVEKSIEPGVLNMLVPRMMLQPLVENAIHHGMRDGEQPLCIRIEATTSNGSLTLTVSDDGVGLRGKKLRERVGLRNTRERLERLYGPAQKMEIESPASGGFSVRLVLPAHLAEYRSTEAKREIA